MTPDELPEELRVQVEAFMSDVGATLERYLDAELDHDVARCIEDELRLVIAAYTIGEFHFTVTFTTRSGVEGSLLVTDKGAEFLL